MSMKTLDELRGWIVATVDYGLGPDGTNLERLHDIADAIEAELSERYMELPVDADGAPIHVGDTLECHANGYDGVFDAFAVGDGCVIGNHPECELFNNPFKGIHVARYCRHTKPRTVEDVLGDFAKRVLNSGHQWGLDAEETTAEYAAELRELMGNTEMAERICHNTSYRLDESRFHCSMCEFGCWVRDVADGHDKLPNYCPNCGAKVVEE